MAQRLAKIEKFGVREYACPCVVVKEISRFCATHRDPGRRACLSLSVHGRCYREINATPKKGATQYA